MSNGKVNNKAKSKSQTRNRSRVNNGKGRDRRSRDCYDGKFDKDNPTNINDASYYFTSDESMKQLTDISFNQFTGYPLNLPNPAYLNTSKNLVNVPSLMRVYLNPSAGSVDVESMNNVNNGVNLAAKQLFLRLSAGNMKSTEYGPEDTGLAILGIGQLLAFMSYIKRFFGLVYLTSNRNRIVPNGLINMLGIDAKDFSSHVSDYRARYNYLMDLASRIPFPANIKYFEKCSDIYSHLYLDSPDSQMAQMIAFIPYSTWEFSDTYSDMGSGLHTIPINARNMTTAPTRTMGDLLNSLETLINALFNSSALLKVYSDILRLADKGEISLLSFPLLNSDYTVVPEYNPEISRMLHNATVIGSPVEDLTRLPDGEVVWDEDYHPTKSNDVRGNAGSSSIDYYPAFETPSGYNKIESVAVLDFSHQNPSTSEIVDATRFTAVMTDWYKPEDGGAPGRFTTYTALPDHYVVHIDIIANGVVNSDTDRTIFNSNKASLYAFVSDIAKFSNAPLFQLINTNATEDPSKQIYTQLVGDLNWYTTVDYAYLNRMHDFAILGLLTLR